MSSIPVYLCSAMSCACTRKVSHLDILRLPMQSCYASQGEH